MELPIGKKLITIILCFVHISELYLSCLYDFTLMLSQILLWNALEMSNKLNKI